MQDKPAICLVPVIKSIAGPGSFQLKLKAELEKRGYPVVHDPADPGAAVILVIAGTRDLSALKAAKARGVRIVQRLNGINYVHRKIWTGPRHFIRAERGNWLLNHIRSNLADAVIYQSGFTHDWWHDWYGGHQSPSFVIRNGVDTSIYHPNGPELPPADHLRVQVVEGALNVDNGPALENAFRFAAALSKAAQQPVELVILSNVDENLKKKVEARVPGVKPNYQGVLPRDQVPALSRTAHLQYSAEVNPSCPNSVVEALACGLPVVGYETGSLPELVQGDAGVLVPYGSDPWKLGLADAESLAQACLPMLKDLSVYKQAARELAVSQFSIEQMTDAYLSVLLPSA